MFSSNLRPSLTQHNVAKPRGFAFVEYEDPEDAQHAIENMNNAEFYGKVLKVNLARPDAIRNSRSTASTYLIAKSSDFVTLALTIFVVWEREEFLKRDLQKRQKPEEEEEEDEPKDKMDTSK